MSSSPSSFSYFGTGELLRELCDEIRTRCSLGTQLLLGMTCQKERVLLAPVIQAKTPAESFLFSKPRARALFLALCADGDIEIVRHVTRDRLHQVAGVCTAARHQHWPLVAWFFDARSAQLMGQFDTTWFVLKLVEQGCRDGALLARARKHVRGRMELLDEHYFLGHLLRACIRANDVELTRTLHTHALLDLANTNMNLTFAFSLTSSGDNAVKLLEGLDVLTYVQQHSTMDWRHMFPPLVREMVYAQWTPERIEHFCYYQGINGVTINMWTDVLLPEQLVQWAQYANNALVEEWARNLQ